MDPGALEGTCVCRRSKKTLRWQSEKTGALRGRYVHFERCKSMVVQGMNSFRQTQL